MVNNSTNINKTNNHLWPQQQSPLTSTTITSNLNNNHLSPQQQSPLTSTTITSNLKSLNIKKTTTYDVGNPDLGLGQAQKCGWGKPFKQTLQRSYSWTSLRMECRIKEMSHQRLMRLTICHLVYNWLHKGKIL
jgi:hypothetical protein